MFTGLLCSLHPQLQNDISGIELPTFQYLQNPGIDYLIISVGSHPHNWLCFLSQQLNLVRSRRQQGKAVITWFSQKHISQAGSSWWLVPGLGKPLDSDTPGLTQTGTESQQAQYHLLVRVTLQGLCRLKMPFWWLLLQPEAPPSRSVGPGRSGPFRSAG